MDTTYTTPQTGQLTKRPFWYYVVNAFGAANNPAISGMQQDAQVQDYYTIQNAAMNKDTLLKWALIGGGILTAIVVYKKVIK
jgi:hypothetical protein